MANIPSPLSSALRQPNKSTIPDRFLIARYADAANRDAAWWGAQLGNRQFLQKLLRAGHIEQFKALSLRMQADPFADLGVRYNNASGAPLGSRNTTSVTPLSFKTATLLAELQLRICCDDKASCDDALADTASRPDNDDLVDFASVAHICIDLAATDKKILSDFGLFLRRHRRKSYAIQEIRSELSDATFRRWVECRVLPCFDIILWAESESVKIGPTELGVWLGVGAGPEGNDLTGINGKDFYIKKVKPALKQAFDRITFRTLYTLSQQP